MRGMKREHDPVVGGGAGHGKRESLFKDGEDARRARSRRMCIQSIRFSGNGKRLAGTVFDRSLESRSGERIPEGLEVDGCGTPSM